MEAPVAQMCFGSGAQELNLQAVQQRIADLIRVMDQLLAEMQSQGAHWTSFLDKLSVINMNHMKIVSEVRPLLRQYTIYPKFVDNPGIEQCLPEMLASRLLPEQVEEEAAWRSGMPGGLAQLAAQPNVCLDYADSQVVELQDLVGWLTNAQHVTKSKDPAQNPTPRDLAVGVLDPKGKLLREVEATSREIAAAAAAAAAAREQAGGSLAGQQPPPASVVVGQKRSRPGQQQADAAAGAGAAASKSAESDALVAKIVSGDLWPRHGKGGR